MHISIGTFKPVVVDDIEDHQMDKEYFDLTEIEADKINKAKSNGKRVVTTGTTCTRVVEHCYKNDRVQAQKGYTNLFIYPGYQYKGIDGLITNFHTPKSTPFLLTSAFGGTDLIRKSYDYAISKEFRFYSYGDSMLIL